MVKFEVGAKLKCVKGCVAPGSGYYGDATFTLLKVESGKVWLADSTGHDVKVRIPETFTDMFERVEI